MTRVSSAVLVATACATACAAASPSLAQAPRPGASDTLARGTAALRPVVVTATRLAVPQAAPTATATVITAAELRARGITHVADALRDVPNAAVLQNGSFGSQTGLFLRGGDPRYVQVLVDGVPVNEAGGAFNFGNLTVDNVERIEVLRGPASVLYGSDAVTGVVQIFTRRGTGAPRASLAARGGSYGTVEGEGTASGSAGPLGWSAGGARYGSNGILAFNNRYRNESGSATLRLTGGARGDATLALRAQRAQFNYPTNSAGLAVDSNAFRGEERATASLDAGRFVAPRLELRTQLGLAGLRGRNDDRADGPADTLGFSQGYVSRDGTTRRDADLRANWYLAPRTVVTVGADYRGTRFRSADTTVLKRLTSPGQPLAAARDNRAAYLQLLGDLGRGLTATLGGRYDDNSAFGAFRTIRAGLGAALPGGTGLRMAAGNAFREPTMFENFARSPYNYGNPALRPERTRSFEAGATQQLGRRAALGATYYVQRFRDVVQYGSAQRLASGDSTNYFNVAAANAAGLELEGRLTAAAGLDVAASYTRSDTRVTDAGLQSGPGATFVAGNRLLRRPADLAALTVTRAFAPGGSVALRVNYTGRRDDRDFNTFPATPVVLPSFTTVNLAAAVPVLHGSAARSALTLTARAENLLDRRYEPVLGFRAPGRTVLVGARLDAMR